MIMPKPLYDKGACGATAHLVTLSLIYTHYIINGFG